MLGTPKVRDSSPGMVLFLNPILVDFPNFGSAQASLKLASPLIQEATFHSYLFFDFPNIVFESCRKGVYPRFLTFEICSLLKFLKSSTLALTILVLGKAPLVKSQKSQIQKIEFTLRSLSGDISQFGWSGGTKSSQNYAGKD